MILRVPDILELVIGLSVSDCGYGKTKHFGRYVAYYRVSTADGVKGRIRV
jgi:hypothetical protein